MSRKMELSEELVALPAIGEAFAGGFLGALMPAPGGRLWAIVVSPKEQGQKSSVMWGMRNVHITGARSFTDGMANSQAMNDERHLAAQFCSACRAGGYEDWYMPSVAELVAVWANLSPVHSSSERFRLGAPEAFDEAIYWSSTEVGEAPSYAWVQHFSNHAAGAGGMADDDKYSVNTVRAVRRVLL